MTKKNQTLISDLARLIMEHPESEWLALRDSINDESFRERLSSSLETLADLAARTVVARGSKRKPPSLPKRLAYIKKEDPEKARILFAFRDKLTQRTTRPSVAQLRGFAVTLGMKNEPHARREQIVNQIIRNLADLTIEEVEASFKTELPEQRNSADEYGSWVDLILQKHSRSE